VGKWLHQHWLLSSTPTRAAPTTTWTNWEHRHTGDYFNYSYLLESSSMASLVPSTTSREQIPTSHLHQQTVAAPSTTATTSSTNHPRIKLSDLYLSLTCCSYDQLLVCVCLPTGESFQSCTCVSYLSVYASQRAWNPPELHFDNYIVRNPHFRWLLCACHALYLSQCWLPFRTRCLLLTVANQL